MNKFRINRQKYVESAAYIEAINSLEVQNIDFSEVIPPISSEFNFTEILEYFEFTGLLPEDFFRSSFLSKYRCKADLKEGGVGKEVRDRAIEILKARGVGDE